MDQHEYLLRTNSGYRQQYVELEVLRMARLVEALAIREGLTINDDGTVDGLTDEEQSKLQDSGASMGVTRMGTREFIPAHADIAQEVAPVDTYALSPDPEAHAPVSEDASTNVELVSALGEVPPLEYPGAEDAGEEGVSPADDQGEGLTADELKDELRARGLSTKGSKAELQSRLDAAAAEDSTSEA